MFFDNTDRISRIITSFVFLALGIVALLSADWFMKSISQLTCILLFLTGCIRIAGYLFNRHNDSGTTLTSLLGGFLSLVFGTILLLNTEMMNSFIKVVIAIWSILTGVIYTIVATHYRQDGESGWPVVFLVAALSFGIGIFLMTSGYLWKMTLSVVFAVYFVTYGLSGVLDSFLVNRDKPFRPKRRISLPLWLEAYIPKRFLTRIKKRLKSESLEKEHIIRDKALDAICSGVELLVHMADNKAFGHIDMAIGNYVLSYCNYDRKNPRFFSTLYDGVFFVVSKKQYLKFELLEENKVVMGYRIHMDADRLKILENNIQEFFNECTPWQPDLDKLSEDDPAYRLKKSTDVRFFKIKRRKFKTYFLLNTNCAKLVEEFMKGTGFGRARVLWGTVTPGACCAYYEQELGRRGSMVIERNLYVKSDD